LEKIIYRLVEVFIYGGIVQGFFFSLIIFRNKRWEKRSNKILALLLITLSISIAHSILIEVDLGGPFKIKEPFVLLIGPLLYFYTRELISSRPFSASDVIHLVPFLVFALLILPLTITDVFKNNCVINDTDTLSVGLWVITIFQYAFYWWKIVAQINVIKTSLQTEFSNLEGKTLLWMKNFLHIFGICLLILTITIPVAIHTNNYRIVDLIVCISLVATVFVLSYEGLFQEEVFSNITSVETIEEVQVATSEEGKPDRSEYVNNELWQKLQSYMTVNKPYLEEGLTLTGLAQNLSMTRNQLSAMINNKTGENFYQFINTYRVEEVKRNLSDPAKKNYTILAMAYDAGFPSKSSFHSIFKKYTGLTPSEYIKKLQ